MKANRIDNQAKNILSAYWLAKAATEHLNYVWSDKHLISDGMMKEAIRQSLPKLNYFIKNVENTFIEANIKDQYMDSQRDFIYEMIDNIWENDIKELMPRDLGGMG
jgi:hypothetical protein